MYIAVDWAGDPGFKSGALSYCAMAIVVSETTEEIDAALQDVRTTRGLGSNFEFKHSKTHLVRKQWFMERMAKIAFTSIVVIYDKNVMEPPWSWGKNDDLLAQLLLRGLLQLPRPAIENAKMVIDGDAEAKKLGRMIRRLLSHDAKTRGLDYRIDKIVSGDSTAYGTLQLADMIGGAAVEAWQQGVRDTPLLRLVRGKVASDVITPDMEKPAT